MSSLDKLGIRGIRSFDANEFNVIQFYHPLTVIVGHNGSGKTTIIECLKYVTTGDMPPNTKGGAFVHDPNMAGETEIKAEVKLRFINTNRDRMTATRRLQVTKKKTALSLKTLEGTIAYTNEEDADRTKRRALSTRNSDLDEEIPRLLGVSKSILENVIFCHQEESTWPLSEPSILKKKFDDIFEATKYTKALDQIKSIRKEHTVELKVDRERLLALKNDRDRAVKIEATILKLEKEIEGKGIEKEGLDEEVFEVTKHNKRFYELSVEHSRILNEVQNLQVKKSITEKAVRSLQQTMTDLPGTKQDLQRRKANFEHEVRAKQQQKATHKRNIDSVEDEILQSQKRLQKLNTERGGLQAELERLEQALTDRDSTVRTLASQFEIRGYDVIPLEDNQVQDFDSRLSAQMQAKKRESEELRDSGKRTSDKQRAAISSLEFEQRSLRVSRDDLKRQQSRLEQRIDECTLQLDNARNTELDVQSLKIAIQEVLERRSKVLGELESQDLDGHIQDGQKRQRLLEDTRDGLHSELTALNKQSDTRAKVALKRSDAAKKHETINALLKSHSSAYTKQTGAEISEDKMAETLRNSYLGVTDEAGRAERALAAKQRDLHQIESSLSLMKQQQAKAEEEIKEITIQIEEETEGQDLATAISEAELEITTRRTSIEQLRSAEVFYQRVLDYARNKDVCVACSRGLSQADMPAFEAYVKKQMSSNPKRIKEEEADLPQWQTILDSLRKLEPQAASIRKLKEESLPNIEAVLQRLTTQHETALSAVDEASAKLAELKVALRQLDSLKQAAVEVSRNINEVADLRREIVSLERQLEVSGTTRTVDDIQRELDKISADLSILKKDMDAHSQERQMAAEKVRACDLESNAAQLKLKDAERQAEQRKVALKTKFDTEEEKSQLIERIEAITASLAANEPDVQNLQRELRTVEEEQRDKETTAFNTQSALSKGYEDLQRAMQLVRRGRQTDNKSKLRRCDAEITELTLQGTEQQYRMSQLRETIGQMEKDESQAAVVQRNVDDNIQYREMREELHQIEQEIASKDIEGANRAKESFDGEYRKSSQRLSALQAQTAKLGGEIALQTASLVERKSELNDQYKDICKLYTRQLIKVKTADFAIQDLEKYGKALDNAIMKYHGHKMQEINETAQALWNKCYQGTDIDTIMIKSDSDNATKVGNRSYNYRVVMVKDQVEMDMRGRCSAGQKVLASIIIRLSLAESFGTNCGILALDEPTTNLDRDNIAALASALADIIKERRQQSNFQLIIITHDEDFLTALGASGALEKYWRVKLTGFEERLNDKD